jgi:chromatin remodeling complex protein RSC6
MARQTKATKTVDESSSTPVVQSVAPVAVPASAPVVADSSSAPKVKKTVTKAKKEADSSSSSSAPVVATPAPVVASASPAIVEEVVVEADSVESPLSQQSNEFFAKLQQLGAVISALKTEYKTLEKRWTRELKTSAKLSTKRKRKVTNRAPSGFVKPTRISDELASFLGKTAGCEMARTEVTRDINQYIRANSLQDKTNGRKINPDSKLAGLLKIQKGEELTYFNLQRYMSPHFAKSDKSVVVAPTSA